LQEIRYMAKNNAPKKKFKKILINYWLFIIRQIIMVMKIIKSLPRRFS